MDKYTVSLSHPDAQQALMSGNSEVTAHFASPPFQEQELADPRVKQSKRPDGFYGWHARGALAHLDFAPAAQGPGALPFAPGGQQPGAPRGP